MEETYLLLLFILFGLGIWLLSCGDDRDHYNPPMDPIVPNCWGAPCIMPGGGQGISMCGICSLGGPNPGTCPTCPPPGPVYCQNNEGECCTIDPQSGECDVNCGLFGGPNCSNPSDSLKRKHRFPKRE
jgi:hypothetical protein